MQEKAKTRKMNSISVQYKQLYYENCKEVPINDMDNKKEIERVCYKYKTINFQRNNELP